DLTDAVLSGADLTRANLDGTVLRRAHLDHANLQGASLFATIIEAADLSGANLSDARIIGYLRSANLTGVTARNAKAGADPGNQSMGVMRATFVGANLTGADFSGANLFKADLSHATLSGAKLAGADLSNSELVETDLTKSDVTGAKFAKANLDGADFRGATGVNQMQGLDQARNKDKAFFDATCSFGTAGPPRARAGRSARRDRGGQSSGSGYDAQLGCEPACNRCEPARVCDQ